MRDDEFFDVEALVRLVAQEVEFLDQLCRLIDDADAADDLDEWAFLEEHPELRGLILEGGTRSDGSTWETSYVYSYQQPDDHRLLAAVAALGRREGATTNEVLAQMWGKPRRGTRGRALSVRKPPVGADVSGEGRAAAESVPARRRRSGGSSRLDRGRRYRPVGDRGKRWLRSCVETQSEPPVGAGGSTRFLARPAGGCLSGPTRGRCRCGPRASRSHSGRGGSRGRSRSNVRHGRADS